MIARSVHALTERAANGSGGLAALAGGGLHMRRNLHVAAGFLAAARDRR